MGITITIIVETACVSPNRSEKAEQAVLRDWKLCTEVHGKWTWEKREFDSAAIHYWRTKFQSSRYGME